jgi:hypothetical protein
MLKASLRVVLALTLIATIPVIPINSSAAASEEVSYPSDIQVHAGGYYTCAFNDLGAVKCWGSVDMTPPSDLGKVIYMSAGFNKVCAVELGGTLVCWGEGGLRETDTPSDLGLVKKVSVGGSTCAITASDYLRCWGDIPTLSTQEKVRQVSVGDSTFCAINFANKVDCWFNSVKFNPIPEIKSEIVEVQLKSNRGCALTITQELKCWGSFSTTQKKAWTGVKNFSLGLSNQYICIQQESALCFNTSVVRIDGLFAMDTTRAGNIYWGQVSIGYNHICTVKQTKAIACKDFSFRPNGKLDVPTPKPGLHRGTTDDRVAVITWERDSFFPAIPRKLTLQALGAFQQITCETDTNACKFEGLTNGTYYRVAGDLPWEQVLEDQSTVILPRITFQVIPKWKSTGTAKLDSSNFLVLKLATGTWNPTPALTYKWFRNGVELPNETQSSISINTKDLTAKYKAEIKTTNPWFTEISQTTAEIKPTPPTVPCMADLDGSIWLGSKQQPSVSGKAFIGEKLVGKIGEWPKGTKVCSFWYSNGKALTSKNTLSYTTPSSIAGKSIQFVVVGTPPSGAAVARFSDPLAISKKLFPKIKPFVISGKKDVGSDLSTKTPSWAVGAKYSYQWMRNDSMISGAKKSSYKISENDLNSSLTLKVCGAKSDYISACATSSRFVIPIGKIYPVGKPSVKAKSSLVGSSVVLNKGSWPSGTTTAISWLRDGDVIPDQSGTTYLITKEDRGKTLSVRLAVSKPKYADSTFTIVVGKIP